MRYKLNIVIKLKYNHNSISVSFTMRRLRDAMICFEAICPIILPAMLFSDPFLVIINENAEISY